MFLLQPERPLRGVAVRLIHLKTRYRIRESNFQQFESGGFRGSLLDAHNNVNGTVPMDCVEDGPKANKYGVNWLIADQSL